MSIGSNFVWPNAFANCFDKMKRSVGLASAIYSLMQMGGGGIIGSIASTFPDNNQNGLACIILISSTISLALAVYAKNIYQR